MTNVIRGYFNNQVELMTGYESWNFYAPLVYAIDLPSMPEVMDRCMATGGFYKDQLRFSIESDNETDSHPYTLRVDIHGDINPGYGRTLSSLFGTEIGEMLTSTGEAYNQAIKRYWNETADGQGSTPDNPSIVLRLLEERSGHPLAVQVYERLMANSTFE